MKNNIVNLIKTEDCIACQSCKTICPIKCIEMKHDEEGFLNPIVDEEKCLSCKLCIEKCPVINKVSVMEQPQIYAAYNKNNNIRKISSSGGIFYSLAKYVIQNDGIVFGAAFNEKFNVIHIGVDNIDSIHKLLGSKYVQSDLNNIYSDVHESLQKGKKVLFSGTPCQVAGLRSFLGDKMIDHLILIDFICHGVPSPLIWKEYLNELAKMLDGKIKSINFRDKKLGWKKYSFNLIYGKDLVYNNLPNRNTYFYGFLNNIFLSKACYDCDFKGINRYSDITLSDFWGYEKFITDIDTNDGLSMVLLNSEKGKKCFDDIRKDLIVCKIDNTNAIINNVPSTKSVKLNSKRKQFFKFRKKHGTWKALNKFCKPSKKQILFGNLKRKAKKLLF